MPETIYKVYNILLRMKSGLVSNGLKLSIAAPPLGARPITSFASIEKQPDIYDLGSVWWGENLKGLIYHLVMYD